MKISLATLVLTAVMAAVSSSQTPSHPEDPAPPATAVEITNGPVVESVTDTTAVIAWSTNVNAGTVLHYGTDPRHLDKTAGMPWGGLTHRVDLRELKPDTNYFFQAESPRAQGTGTSVTAPRSFFRTKTAVACTGPCT